MTILKKLFFMSVLTVNFIAMNAVSMEGFEPKLLNPYIVKARDILRATADELENKIGDYLSWRAPSFAEQLYPLQKAALEEILKELKHAVISVKNCDQATYKTARQLYKAFKYNVYESWKKTQILPGVTTDTIIGYSKKPIYILE